MIFVEYARARGIGLAMKQIKSGESIINAQLEAGYESSSGFGDAFSRIMGDVPTKTKALMLKATWLDTPLGSMLCVADDAELYLLEFIDRCGLELEIVRLRKRLKAAIISGETSITQQTKQEIDGYFKGDFKAFTVPLHLVGSDFQKQVWDELMKIPLGETRAYADIAKAIKRPKAFRAVARANGTNQIAIIIPCHRVINTNGNIGGYAGGVNRKQWLLQHESEDYMSQKKR